MKKFAFTTSLITILASQAFSQDNIDSLLNELLYEDEEFLSLLERSTKYHYLYFSSNFRSNTFFAGRDFGIDQFNWSNQISYFHSNGISFSVAGILYEEFVPRYNTTIVSLGYGKNLNKIKGLRLRASYDRYIFAQVDSLEESSFNSALNLGASYRWKNFRTSASYSFLIGPDPSSQFNWDFQARFDLWKKSPLKRVSFEPAVALLFGNETVQTTSTVQSPRRFLQNFIETSTLTEKYGLLSTQLRLPLSLTYNNFDFEVGYNYNLPRSLGDESIQNTSFFSVRVGYLISFKGKK